MSQSSAIAAALIIAFIVFITVRGHLPCYFDVLGIETAGNAQCPLSITGQGTTGTISTGFGGSLGAPAGSVNIGGSGIGIGLPPVQVSL